MEDNKILKLNHQKCRLPHSAPPRLQDVTSVTSQGLRMAFQTQYSKRGPNWSEFSREHSVIKMVSFRDTTDSKRMLPECISLLNS